MASAVKFLPFVENICEKRMDLGSDVLKLVLTNTAPSNTDSGFLPGSAHPPPAATNGYTSGGHTVTITASSQTSGTYKLVGNDVVITATAGGIGSFRYILLYDDTATSDDLILTWDYGSSITLASGESLTIDLDGSAGILQLA